MRTISLRARADGIKAVVNGMAGKLAVVLLNTLTGLITARALQAAGRGEQAAMILWPVLISSAMTLGIPTALTYSTRRYKDLVPELTGAALLVGLLVSTIAGTVAFAFMPALLNKYPPHVVFAAQCFLLTVPIGMFMLVARSALEAEGDFRTSIQAQWLTPSLTLALLILMLVGGRLTPLTASLAYTLNGIPVAIWLYVRLRRATNVRIRKFASTANLLLSYGLRCYGIDLCGTLAIYVDQAFVVNLLPARAMGIYVVALSASRILNFCQASVVMVLLPKVAHREPSEVISLTGRAARVSLALTALLAAGGMIASPFAVRLLYGNSYIDSVTVLRILLIEVTLAGTVMVLAQAPMALGRPGIVTILQTTGLFLTIPLMLLLIPTYGLRGAALSLLTSTVIRFVLIKVSFKYVLKVKSPRVLISLTEIRELWQDIRPFTGALRSSQTAV